MRPHAAFAALLAVAAALPASAARKPPAPNPQASAQVSGPPHAWLFGTWTGGLFPVLDGMTLQDCRTQPTVAFAQDVVAHAALTTPGLKQRVIETVRTSPTGAEFRLTPDPSDPAAFGCDGPDTLHVLRESNDKISFPNCAAFPYPLQRCPHG